VARKCNLGNYEVRHKFLCLPDSPVGLMGRDLLCKLRAQIAFDLDGTTDLKLRGLKDSNPHSFTKREMAAFCP
jgi:hypothetical protein